MSKFRLSKVGPTEFELDSLGNMLPWTTTVLEALSEQLGIPDPSNPAPITTNLPAGTYKVQDYRGDWYEFTLSEDLHGIGDVRDVVEWDKYNPEKGWLRNKFDKLILDGTIRKFGQFSSVYNNRARLELPHTSTNYILNDALCNYFIYKPNVYNDTPNEIGFVTTPGSSLIRFGSESSITDLTLANAWLVEKNTSGNPLYVIYQLATPTRTPLTFTLNNASTAPIFPFPLDEKLFVILTQCFNLL